MPLSFTFRPGPDAAKPAKAVRRKVLVTGAAGHIGSYFAEHGREKYDLRLMDRDFGGERERLQTFGELLEGSLGDPEFLKRACVGVDTVVHLAGNPDAGAPWPELLEDNVIGAYHAMTAAKAAGCRRVIFASSIHAVSGYPAEVQVKTSETVNPGDLYGVTKCFGEALGRYLAEQEGLSVIALRIGAFQPRAAARKPGNLPLLDAFVSRRDLDQLIHCCIDAEARLRFAIFHGLSNNRYKRMDLTDARELVGYAPQDDFAEENPLTSKIGLAAKVMAHNLSDGGKRSGIREDARKEKKGKDAPR